MSEITKSEKEIFREAVRAGKTCYLVRVGNEWEVLTAEEFEEIRYLKDTYSITEGALLYQGIPYELISETARKQILRFSDRYLDIYLKEKKDQAEKEYRLYSQALKIKYGTICDKRQEVILKRSN